MNTARNDTKPLPLLGNWTRYVSLAGLILSGCTAIQPNQASIRFDSNPPGATISDANETWGVAPQTRIWTLRDATAVTGPVRATWVSGATTTVRLNLTAGQEGVWSFQRPQNAPGLDQDIQWARHLAQEKERQQAATNQMYRDFGNAIEQGLNERNRTRHTTCIGLGRDMMSCTSD